VRVAARAGTALGGVAVDVTDTATATSYDVVSAAADVVVGGLPVNTAPGSRRTYAIGLDASNTTLDLTTATLRVFNENGGLIRNCALAQPGCGSIDVAPGGQPRAVISVSRYGTLTGAVIGNNGSGSTTPLVPPDLTVLARRVATPTCTAISPGEAPRPVVAVDTDGVGGPDSFRFSGPAGLYRLEFSHPDYQSAPTAGPPQAAQDICTVPNPFPPPVTIQDPYLTGAVFRVVNDVDRVLPTPFFTLPIRPSVLTVTVRNDTLTDQPGDVGDGVPDATVTATGIAGTFTLPTGSSGVAVFDGPDALPPGA
jgi:hypothetical protein